MLVRLTGIGAWCLAVSVSLASYGAEGGGVKFSKRCLMVSPNESCAIGDINKDGKPDIVAGTHWFAAPDFIPRPIRDIPELPKEYYANNGDMVYDVDGDGLLDVISMGWMEPEINWYKNPGPEGLMRGWKFTPNVLVKARTRNEAAALKDLDGDGVPEVIVSCWNKKEPLLAWKFAKDDKGQPTLQEIVIGDQGGGHGHGFGDVNGDGREDILCEMGWYERPAKDLFAAPWKFHPETALAHPSCPFLVRDLNGDGRNDLVWGKAHDFGLYWWEQGQPQADGTTTWKEHLIDDTWSQVHCLVMADLDGDGKDELITGKRVRAHNGRDPGGKDPECLWYYTWCPKELKFTRYPISPLGGGVGSGMQICVADLNGDGRPDVAVAGKTGTWLLINDGK